MRAGDWGQTCGWPAKFKRTSPNKTGLQDSDVIDELEVFYMHCHTAMMRN